jgi:hypothetical protein
MLHVYNVKKQQKIHAKNAKFLDFQGGLMQTTEMFCVRFIHDLCSSGKISFGCFDVLIL